MAAPTASERTKRFETKILPSQVENQDFDKTIGYYSAWAKAYEEDMGVVGYVGPQMTAEHFAKLGLPNHIKILDTACGTGQCAMYLRDRYGYTNIDGLDACNDMLAIAAERKVYRKIINSKMGDGCVMPIDDNTYDAITMAGGLGAGHIKLDAFADMIRITKPGGYIVIVTRDSHRRTAVECKDLDVTFAEYERKGLWTKISETITKNYVMEHDGLVLVYRVKKDQR